MSVGQGEASSRAGEAAAHRHAGMEVGSEDPKQAENLKGEWGLQQNRAQAIGSSHAIV